MTHAQGNREGRPARRAGLAAAAVAAAAVVAGCTSTTGTTDAAPSGGAPTATPTGASSGATTPACGTPPKVLLDRAIQSVAAHPGPVKGSTYVYAATTATGDWYVLGIDRAYVTDDGSPGAGPNGDHSRSLTLVNAAAATDGSAGMIPLTGDLSAKNPVSWDRVSWSGDTLAAGQRAAERAVTCLDHPA